MDDFQSEAYGADHDKEDSDSSSILLSGSYEGRWGVTAPRKDSNETGSDLHQFDPINEERLEEVLQVLKRGDFDNVLEIVWNEFTSEGLNVFVVTHSSGGRNSIADPASKDELFHLMIPLFLPREDDIEHGNCIAPVKLMPNVGVLSSREVSHSAGGFDYRATRVLE